jgi:transposase
MRSGELTPIDVPSVEAEALRALSRARAEAIRALKGAQGRLTAVWLRHDSRSTGRAPWGPAPRRGLSAVIGAPPAQPSVCQEDVRAGTAHPDRVKRRAQALQAQTKTWRLVPLGAALQARRGVHCTVAVPLVAALGARTRCDKPRPRMSDLGLRPAAYASGERRPQGGITTAGHTHARRALVEGAWACRDPAKGRRHLQRRLEQRPKSIQAIRWKAHVRRCTRYRKLSARGTNAHHVVVASARERIAFRWAMTQEVPRPA